MCNAQCVGGSAHEVCSAAGHSTHDQFHVRLVLQEAVPSADARRKSCTEKCATLLIFAVAETCTHD